jgi:hypothetical protein
MTGHVSLWSLSRELGTYVELLAGLCVFHDIEMVDGVRGRMVKESDRQLVADLLYAWRSRPKLSYLSGKAPARRRSATRKSRRPKWASKQLSEIVTA